MKLRTPRTSAIRRMAVVLLSSAVAAGALVAFAGPAAADNTTISYNNFRTAWDPNEAGLSPSSVGASDFGQLFSTAVDGQVYAQPISVGGTLVVTTENDNIYGLNLQTGAIKWSRNVGPAWPAATIGCGDLVPNIGSTSTPVYDPATNSLFFTTKVAVGGNAQTPAWYMHSIDPATGAERAGWPTIIQGSPTNDPTHPFNPFTAMQRPGLLLLGGVVYAGFASHCDYGAYVGYIVGVKTSTPALSTMWATETGNSRAEAGVWQSGGGLVSDGPGQIIFTTGNGVSPAPGPGNTPPSTLAESVVRLAVGADGNLTAKDYFSPANNTGLDTDDADLGSGGPMAIPDGYGTAAHPHLLVQIGKDGRLFLLDRDNLGGTAQGPGGTDAVLSVAGPYAGVWGHPAFYGGTDGGYVYTVENGGYLRASKVGASASGVPTLTSAGTTADTFGYTSGSPVVTSDGTTAGSGLVWVERVTGPQGGSGTLRAYNAVPQNGTLNLVYSVSIGQGSKFAVPATDGSRVYVGTRDGHVLGFGRPAASALTAAPVNFGSVAVGTKSSKTLTVTTTKALTITGVSTAAPFTASLPGGSATLAAGASLAVPVSFTPTGAGAASGTATFTTSAGTVGFDLNGVGTQAGLAASPTAIDFGTIPTGANKTLSVTIANTGTTAATITSSTAPTSPFTASLPAAGTTIAAGGSIAISVKYAPIAAGPATSSVKITGSTGSVTVAVTGTGISGSPHLTIAPSPLAFGATLLGTTASSTFQVSNTGNTNLTITKAAPPVGLFNTTTPIAEGQQIVPGEGVQQNITFTPTAPGSASASYLITGDDGQGAQNETITATAGLVDNFIGKASGNCMDVSNAAATNGTAIWLYNCNGTPAQTWRVGANSSLRSALGKCLDVTNAATANGSPVQLYSCNGTSAQMWQLTTTGTLKNPASGRCLTPAGEATFETTRLQIADCDGSAAQIWQQPHRTGPIVGQASNRCLDVVDGVTINATPVQLYDCNGTGSQSWSIAAGGTVQALGKCLGVHNGATANGSVVDIFTCNGTAAQQWRLQANGALQNPNSGRCLAPVAGGTFDGTRMQLLDCAAVPAQLWSLT